MRKPRFPLRAVRLQKHKEARGTIEPPSIGQKLRHGVPVVVEVEFLAGGVADELREAEVAGGGKKGAHEGAGAGEDAGYDGGEGEEGGGGGA